VGRTLRQTGAVSCELRVMCIISGGKAVRLRHIVYTIFIVSGRNERSDIITPFATKTDIFIRSSLYCLSVHQAGQPRNLASFLAVCISHNIV